MGKKVKKPKGRARTFECVYCRKGVIDKVDGGKIQIPFCASNGHFPEYLGPVYLHNSCLKSVINMLEVNRKAISNN